MVKLGYKLMSEEQGSADLVRNAKRAEQAGLDFADISDHYFPSATRRRKTRSLILMPQPAEARVVAPDVG
jgi:alkanesulfonate monooxygenase SsuD/methylene tetrahydromethanopterin reductase-like flavin-dependent oxidoreductase (luciferase family)